MNGYILVKENGMYGISNNGQNVLPCIYDAIWRHSEILIGFRSKEYYGLFSLTEGKVVVAPVLGGEFTCYLQYNELSGKPRFKSVYGIHSEEKIFIESVHHLLKEEGVTMAFDGIDVVLVHDDGEIETISAEDDKAFNYYYSKVSHLSFIQTSDDQLVLSYEGNLTFYSAADVEQYIHEHPVNQAKAQVKFIKYLDQVLQEKGIEKNTSEEKAGLPVYKVFNFEAIPACIINKCEEHLTNYYAIVPEFSDYTKNLVYLAWLYANNYIVRLDNGIDIPDAHFDYEDPEGEGQVMNSVYMFYDLHKIVPLLKMSNMTQGYLLVLVYSN